MVFVDFFGFVCFFESSFNCFLITGANDGEAWQAVSGASPVKELHEVLGDHAGSGVENLGFVATV